MSVIILHIYVILSHAFIFCFSICCESSHQMLHPNQLDVRLSSSHLAL
jgi:hypothetical protein